MTMADQMTTIPLEDWIKLESENARLREEKRELIEELINAADTFRDFAAMDRALLKPIRAAGSEIAEESIRALLARVNAKEKI